MNTEYLHHIRHSLAHLLAHAVSTTYPEARLTLGPSVEDGFYYDIDFGTKKIGDSDLPGLEKKMRELLRSWDTFVCIEVSADDARTIFKDNPYKLELINEIDEKGEKVTLYYSGPKDEVPRIEDLKETTHLQKGFVDLCRGGHVESPKKDIDPHAFALDRVAGAYWRGDENNPMLTRIYGFAFLTKDELEAYQTMRKEAQKRDHRKLGRELDLFTFSELVGSGLPLWTPKGTIIRELLNEYVWSLRKTRGYQKVTIPHFTKKDLYEISGHWQKFSDELFKVQTREGKEFAVKPMNCPHHTQIFAHIPRSYKEMPQRYAETTMVYRDEQSGELSGLTRVLSITQDDAHVFARYSQIQEEFFAVWDMIDTFYKTFGFDLKVRLSFHDPKSPEKYLGTPEVWKQAEDTILTLAQERKADYFVAEGEAAMYGPKCDFMATDSIGRKHQVATIQLDMNMPERFDLTCTNEEGKEERIVMIHAAIMGSIERFSAVLIEHLAGKFPLWLAPVQVKILPIGEKHQEYAKEITQVLKEADIRIELDDSANTLGKKIREVKLEKIPYFLVIGDSEVESKTITVEHRDEGKIGEMSVENLILKLKEEITGKK